MYKICYWRPIKTKQEGGNTMLRKSSIFLFVQLFSWAFYSVSFGSIYKFDTTESKVNLSTTMGDANMVAIESCYAGVVQSKGNYENVNGKVEYNEEDIQKSIFEFSVDGINFNRDVFSIEDQNTKFYKKWLMYFTRLGVSFKGTQFEKIASGKNYVDLDITGDLEFARYAPIDELNPAEIEITIPVRIYFEKNKK